MSEKIHRHDPSIANVIYLSDRIVGSSDAQEAPTNNNVPSQVADMHTLHTPENSEDIKSAQGRHPSSFRQDQ